MTCSSHLSQLLIAVLVSLPAQSVASWTPRPCITDGVPQGQSMEITAHCMEDGIQVTWSPRSGTEVELVQIEYSCTNSTSDSSDQDHMEVIVLQPNTFVTSGSKMIPMPSVFGSDSMQCTISGCTVEGWFLDVYVLAPVSTTCSSNLETESSVSIVPSTSVSVVSSTSIGAVDPITSTSTVHMNILSSRSVQSSSTKLIKSSAHNDSPAVNPTPTTIHYTTRSADADSIDRLHTSNNHPLPRQFSTINERESGVFMQSTATTLSVKATPHLIPTVLLKNKDNDFKLHALTIATPVAIVAILGVLFFVIVVVLTIILCMWSLLEKRFQLKQLMMEKGQLHVDGRVSDLPRKTCVV